ncbi:hypothetical protein QYE76_070995 [Lolium multiflorum]|uniref:Transposase (putative) gypsy type domain-containing protein n=1 Tax=Lolium multiflorum TaxID=4521 RepID=A0AAD8SLJ7_LOLMU|nr:hypothetical protein QYE76_070995 [Lolium multiflorum]
MATPLSSAPPPFAPVHLDPTKDSGKDTEGTSANPEKTSGADQAEQKAEERAKKSKARQRDSEAKGKWWPCTTTEMELKNLEAEGFLQPGSWRTVPNSLAPAPEDNEMVLTKALVERGFSFPPSDFFSEILKVYGLQPHNISPNSVLAISNHVTLCEGHLRDVSDPASERKLPPFEYASETPAWTQCPHLSESPQLTRAVRRICKLTEEGLTGKDLTLSWFTKRIQPLQHRDRLMFHYTGRDDQMRATKDNLSADAIDKRIRLLIKIPRELHVHVCNKDINTNSSGTCSKPSRKVNSEPLSVSPLRATRIHRPHRKRELPTLPPLQEEESCPSSPTAKRAREVLSTAATRKAEAEKKCLKLIDTKQSSTQHRSGSQPTKPSQRKNQAISGFRPHHRMSRFRPKPSATTDPKDVINVDDLPRAQPTMVIPGRAPPGLRLRPSNQPPPLNLHPSNKSKRRSLFTPPACSKRTLLLLRLCKGSPSLNATRKFPP